MVGDAVEFRRNAARMQSVGMMLGRQRPVLLADRRKIVGRLHAENPIRIAVEMDMPFGDHREPFVRD